MAGGGAGGAAVGSGLVGGSSGSSGGSSSGGSGGTTGGASDTVNDDYTASSYEVGSGPGSIVEVIGGAGSGNYTSITNNDGTTNKIYNYTYITESGDTIQRGTGYVVETSAQAAARIAYYKSEEYINKSSNEHDAAVRNLVDDIRTGKFVQGENETVSVASDGNSLTITQTNYDGSTRSSTHSVGGYGQSVNETTPPTSYTTAEATTTDTTKTETTVAAMSDAFKSS